MHLMRQAMPSSTSTSPPHLGQVSTGMLCSKLSSPMSIIRHGPRYPQFSSLHFTVMCSGSKMIFAPCRMFFSVSTLQANSIWSYPSWVRSPTTIVTELTFFTLYFWSSSRTASTMFAMTVASCIPFADGGLD